MTLASPTVWARVPRPRPAPALRLICVPFAGGGASSYRLWAQHLPDHVEVVPVQLPGREDRLDEPPVDSMEPLVDRLVPGLAPYLDRPFALFGHSMGALIAFEVGRRLRSTGLEPVHFFASGCRAPHLPSSCPPRHALPDQAFLDILRDMNGMPEEVMDNPDFIELVMPALRSDFKLVETYVHRSGPQLRCPVSVLGGRADPEVSPPELDGWSRHTTGPFQTQLFPGDHFFLTSARDDVLRLVASHLTSLFQGR